MLTQRFEISSNKRTYLDSSVPSRSNSQGLGSSWPTYLHSVDDGREIFRGEDANGSRGAQWFHGHSWTILRHQEGTTPLKICKRKDKHKYESSQHILSLLCSGRGAAAPPASCPHQFGKPPPRTSIRYGYSCQLSERRAVTMGKLLMFSGLTLFLKFLYEIHLRLQCLSKLEITYRFRIYKAQSHCLLELF